MPRRKTILANKELYHIFNRGVAKMPIYLNRSSYTRFINLIDYVRYENTPTSFSSLNKRSMDERQEIMTVLQRKNELLVEIVSFCLMPNHYHFVLRQLVEKGISKFIADLQNSYGKYFNIRNDRIGPLFQPSFQAVRIETDEQLLHVTRYIHLNPSTSFLVKIEDLVNYEWSSLGDYLIENKRFPFVDTVKVLDILNANKYREFVFDQADYQRELGMIKHLTLE